MSGWNVDGAADNSLPTWSSFDEVEWIDCEEKGDCIEGEIRPGDCIESTPRTNEDITSTSSDQRFSKQLQGQGDSDQNFREQAFSEFGVSESFHSSKTSAEGSSSISRKQEKVYQNHGRSDISDPSIKRVSFTDMDTLVDCANPKRAFISPSKVASCDFTAGLISDISQLSTSNRPSLSGCSESGEEPKYQGHDYDFETAMELYKEETNYQDDSMDAVNNSCQFLLSDIYPQEGDLEFLQVQEGRRDNLLEYGWGNTNNLEDMDKLFLNNDSMLTQGFEDSSDGMLWEPPSPTIGGSPDFIQKGDLNNVETKMTTTGSVKEEDTAGKSKEKVFDKMQTVPKIETSNLPSNSEDDIGSGQIKSWEREIKGPSKISENIEEKHLLQENEPANKVRRVASLPTVDDSVYTPKDGDKAIKAKRHANRAKKFEDNKKTIPGRKLALNLPQAKRSPILYVPVGSTGQECAHSASPMSQVTRNSSCESMNHIQHLQPVPYIHAGFGFPAHHGMPVMVPGPPIMPQQMQPQAQPLFIGYQPPLMDSSKLQRHKSTFEPPSQPPSVGPSSMTPQEKIEKLRWRQKMQARLAVEQQQQQLISQNVISDQIHFQRQDKILTHAQPKITKEDTSGSVRPESAQGAEPLIWNEGSVSPQAVATDDGEESLSANVLQQLLDIASKMDIRTRLCLRDGFRRLAGNALQRRSAGDNRGGKNSTGEHYNRNTVAESSSSSDPSCSQRMLTVEDIVETQTNPMDRFIAHLLFHKRFPSTPASIQMNSNPSESTPDTSEAAMAHQDSWPWPESVPSSEISPSARAIEPFGTSVDQSNSAEMSKSNNVEMAMSDSVCKNTNYNSVISGPQAEGSTDVTHNADDNMKQQDANPDIREMESQSVTGHIISHGRE